jgi:K+-transporting ATPase A subunit
MKATGTPKKAAFGQVVKAVLFAILMIGKRDSRTEDGATVTVAQIFIGTAIGFVVLIAGLVLLVNLIAK